MKGSNDRFLSAFLFCSRFSSLLRLPWAISNPPQRGEVVGDISFKRMLAYLHNMLPLPALIPAGIAKFLSLYLLLQVLGGQRTLTINWMAWAGGISFILFLLLTRVYDELKDADADIRMAAAGDPRYMDRPIVTGAVKIQDIVALRWILTILLVATNAFMEIETIIGFVWAFGFLWLSYKWFFWPAIQDSLLLAFATHGPLTLVAETYTLSLFISQFGSDSLSCWTVILLVGLWTPMLAWETARKQRIATDETDYQTYTKVLGQKVAPLLPVTFVVISVGCIVSVFSQTGLSPIFPALLMAAGLVPIGGCLLFRFAPTAKRAKLQPHAEFYFLFLEVGIVIALASELGIDFV